MTPTVKQEPPAGDRGQDLGGFEVSVSEAGAGVVAVAVRGDLDMLTAPVVAETVERAQAENSVVLDLGDVSFLGSIGLSILVDATRRAEESGRKFVILASNHIVLRAVQATGLDVVLQIFPDMVEATQYMEQ